MEKPEGADSWKEVAAALTVELGVVKEMVYDRDRVLAKLELRVKAKSGQIAAQLIEIRRLERKVARLEKAAKTSKAKTSKAKTSKGKKKK